MSPQENLKAIFLRYLENNSSKADLEILYQHFGHQNDAEQIRTLVLDYFSQYDEKATADEDQEATRIQEEVWPLIVKDIQPIRRIRPVRRIAIAAAVALIALSSIGLLYQRNQSDQILPTTVVSIPAGSNRATITLADGSRIPLSEDQEGIKLSDNELSYADGSKVHTLDKIQKITLSTPKAGQYQVVLSDGTKVWLNAATSLSYPSRFEGNDRTVQLEGEAYFEVTKNKTKPFIVETSKQKIQVLGTQFNVQAYAEEKQEQTSLVEGSVRLEALSGTAPRLLKPGEQAEIQDGNIEVRNIDLQEATAWKDGLYVINNQPLSSFARQIERWYNVELDMGKYENQRMSAYIPRTVNLDEVLTAITQQTGIKFKIEGRKIMVK